jgi:CheY-like chemotaxis protein
MHKIMLVEDDQQILDMMELLLRKIGYEPVLVPDVLDALEQVRRSPPDLVLLDIMMTPLNGWEFLEKVREEYQLRDLPILLFTAAPEVEEKIARMNDPKLGILQKPVSLPELKAGLIVAQEYPALTKMMKPGYEQGLKAVNPKITVDYRVIGNWYDANKAADLANSMIDAGVDVILSIAGGANQGVIKAAKEKGKYVLYFDSNEYKIAPGTIVGCAVLNQEKAAYERVKAAIQGKLAFGKAEIVSARDGYVDFADADPLYTGNVPEDVRRKMAETVKKIRGGQLNLQVPQL